MKDISKGQARNRRDVVYEIEFNAIELDMLYEIVRHTRMSLPDPYDIPEPGSWTDEIIQLDNKFTTIFHERRR